MLYGLHTEYIFCHTRYWWKLTPNTQENHASVSIWLLFLTAEVKEWDAKHTGYSDALDMHLIWQDSVRPIGWSITCYNEQSILVKGKNELKPSVAFTYFFLLISPSPLPPPPPFPGCWISGFWCFHHNSDFICCVMDPHIINFVPQIKNRIRHEHKLSPAQHHPQFPDL